MAFRGKSSALPCPESDSHALDRIAMLTIEMAIADMTEKKAGFCRIWFQNMLEPTVGPFETGLAA